MAMCCAMPRVEPVPQPAPAPAYVFPRSASFTHPPALYTDDQIATDACWALSGACDESIQNIEAVAQAKVIGKMVAMLSSTSVATQTPAVRGLGNMWSRHPPPSSD